MFRTLIYPSSGPCDCAVELRNLSCKVEGFSVSVHLWCIVLCVFGVMGFVALLQLVGVFTLILTFFFYAVIIVFSCVLYVSLVDW